MKRILLIDDDMDMCTLLGRFLQRKGFETEAAYSGNKGIAKFKEQHFDVVLCDFRLGDKEGREVLKEIKEFNPHAVVIIITGYSDIKIAVDVIKHGAFDYITKPLIPEEVLNVINKSLQDPASATGSTGAKKNSGGGYNDGEFLKGQAGTTKELFKQIDLVAPTNYSIILYGESGTGKEVMAKTIHLQSSRKDKPFVALDCGTLSKELVGSELFGHMKGSFTGALGDKEGLFEVANGGTLFLDEVANLSLDIQASLLRVIQERKFKRVGGNKEINADVRILVASNENLQDAYRRGKFREDLYHRFNEFSINIPPLRERREDIPLFADFFLKQSCVELNKEIGGFEDEVMQMFINYPWPGNLREFRNVIRRAALLSGPGSLIGSKVLPWEMTQHNPLKDESVEMATNHIASPVYNAAQAAPLQQQPFDLKNAASQAEYETIMNVLKQVNFNKSKAADILKIDRKTLYNKLRVYESHQHNGE
ncbi:MAG: sigma-54 dependent transcriptional regulator [Bacteroidota bacterium]